MLTLVLLALALTCLLITLLICRRLGVFDDRYAAVRSYARLLEKIGDVYIGDLDNDVVSAAALHAAVDALGDRWSYYMTPAEYADYLDNVNNRYVGIGVGVVADEEYGGMRVTFVYRGSPAETAGIVPGDVIIGVDGEDVTSLELSAISGRLARGLGESVELSVRRADGAVETLVAIYSYVFIDPVSFEMLESGVGYIALANFDSGAARSFISALDTLMEQGADSLIVDLRGNGGGRLVEMTEILDYILPEGEIFVAVDKSGREDVTRSGPDCVDIPIVVLVNRYSYSAAEYFAALLREYDRAVLVGEQTTGKNRMQTTYELADGGALHISTSQYLTPNRVSLYDEGGVTPDHEIPLTDEEFELLMFGSLDKNEDPQLRQALLLLTTRAR